MEIQICKFSQNSFNSSSVISEESEQFNDNKTEIERVLLNTEYYINITIR